MTQRKAIKRWLISYLNYDPQPESVMLDNWRRDWGDGKPKLKSLLQAKQKLGIIDITRTMKGTAMNANAAVGLKAAVVFRTDQLH